MQCPECSNNRHGEEMTTCTCTCHDWNKGRTNTCEFCDTPATGKFELKGFFPFNICDTHDKRLYDAIKPSHYQGREVFNDPGRI